MAPSAGKSPPGTQLGPPKMSTEINIGPNSQPKENQRPPVYNAEDYIISLKKYSRRSIGTNNTKSIYDTSDVVPIPDSPKLLAIENRSSTLPTKQSDYKSPIPSPPETDCEMSLRQFGSITDLLTKLRADLRASFPSFVQELVASPMDGVSLLLEVLRAIQLSQTINCSSGTAANNAILQRNTQSYQRRALLDELACLQCLNLCSTRSPEAGARLGTSPVGLLPLAASATGQGIRSRILALQLLTTACDKTSLGHGSQKSVQCGHTSVSEALSTLRLRCGEPVRFRLLVGMLNSGGGTGELQTFGLKFINTFLGSAENVQNKLYLQAELYQAGFDHLGMTKTISSSSPWLEKLRAEVKHFEETKIDVENLMVQARESSRTRSQMVILERRVQILQEEKTVLTTMERRLQERCAELQREVFRLQGAHHQDGYKSLEKRPVALPRHVPPQSNKTGNSSEQDDEGISSSETGQSLSPEPILVLPLGNTQKYRMNVASDTTTAREDDDTNAASIDDVIEELKNIVIDAEREISVQNNPEPSTTKVQDHREDNHTHIEKEIVPVNLLPQPPRKSRSLAHLLSNGSDFDGSDYGLLMHNGAGDAIGAIGTGDSRTSYFDDLDYENENCKSGRRSHDSYVRDATTSISPDVVNQSSTNREILNVIMDAREKDGGMQHSGFMMQPPQHQVLMRQPSAGNSSAESGGRMIVNSDGALIAGPPAPHKFSGVFFMTEMSTPQKYPKPDITAALEARRVTKNLDRLESYGSGLDSMIDIVLTETANKQMKSGQQILVTGANTTRYHGKPPSGSQLNRGTHSTAGSKLTDLASGLY